MVAWLFPIARSGTRAAFVLVVAVLGSAALGTAAVLVPAPPVALPVVFAACVGLPFVAAHDILRPPALDHGATRPHAAGVWGGFARRATAEPALTARALRLPPPDPHESPLVLAGGRPLPAATVVFAAGPPSPETDRVADRLLDLRPGLLIVVVPG